MSNFINNLFFMALGAALALGSLNWHLHHLPDVSKIENRSTVDNYTTIENRSQYLQYPDQFSQASNMVDLSHDQSAHPPYTENLPKNINPIR